MLKLLKRVQLINACKPTVPATIDTVFKLEQNWKAPLLSTIGATLAKLTEEIFIEYDPKSMC